MPYRTWRQDCYARGSLGHVLQGVPGAGGRSPIVPGVYPVPQISDLSNFSGRPESSYTSFANNALIQSTIIWTTLTQITASAMLGNPDDQALALWGICSYADYLYLRQPYQQVIASPMQNESIGSYSYSKPMAEMARNAQALEVQSEQTGVFLFDLSVRMLALRTRAGGVFHGGVTVFERTSAGHPEGWDEQQGHLAVRFDGAGMFLDRYDGRWVVRGPDEFNLVDWQMIDINAEIFPADPGVG